MSTSLTKKTCNLCRLQRKKPEIATPIYKQDHIGTINIYIVDQNEIIILLLNTDLKTQFKNS